MNKHCLAICLFREFRRRGVLIMPKNRIRQKENRKRKYKEESLDRKTAFGISDPTPFEAVENIRKSLRKEK